HTIPLASSPSLRIHCFFTVFFFNFDDHGAAQFVRTAFSSAFRPRHHFHFSFLVSAGGPFIESAAGGRGYWMAYPHRRADSRDPLPSPHRFVFLHHARPALVCLGVAVRHSDRDSRPRLRIEWSGLAWRLAGGRDLRDAAFAIAAARDRSAAGDPAHATGGGRIDDSYLRASAHCELAFFPALVCCAGALGAIRTLGWGRAREPAALDSLVFSCVDVALGESAWRMDIWNGAARYLHVGGIRRERARAEKRSVCCDSRLAAGSCHGFGFRSLGGGHAGESVWLAAACAHLSLSGRSLPDEPYR